MAHGAGHDERNEPSADRSSRLLVRSILLVGLAMPSLLGLIALLILQVRGVPTISLGQGILLIIPVTLFYEIPFAILALIVRRVFRTVPSSDRRRWVRWMSISVGALVGLTIAAGTDLMFMMLLEGPGGFVEAATMRLALWMITLPVLLVLCAAGAAAGGLSGLILWLLVSRLVHR